MEICGLSSFGYSGTISHSVLRGSPVLPTVLPLMYVSFFCYMRRSFVWQQSCTTEKPLRGSTQNSFYTSSWVKSSVVLDSSSSLASWLVLQQPRETFCSSALYRPSLISESRQRRALAL
eukprot:3600038-Pleurochrysis_carterae.AAC.1